MAARETGHGRRAVVREREVNVPEENGAAYTEGGTDLDPHQS